MIKQGSRALTAIIRLLCLCVVFVSGLPLVAAEQIDWKKVSSPHFIVLHMDDAALAQRVSDQSESYYSTIAADLGYTRYQNFWLWDNRVKIVIYPNAAAFAEACQAPFWAIGRASYERHEIASYRQSGEGFLSNLLPHELAHLILADFIGKNHTPLWLSEGFSQWEEARIRDRSIALPSHRFFPLRELMGLDIRKDTDTGRISLFYAQSASLVGFLIKKHGGEAFGNFCRALRDGKDCEAALTAAYPNEYPSLEVLEEKWLKGTLK